MTSYQQTLKTYTDGDKMAAYAMFLRDESSVPVSFERFCTAFDKMVKRHAENEAATKAHEQAMAAVG